MSMWMNLARGRELAELAGDAVVEAGADADDQVGLVHRVVGGAGAVHAEHPEPLVVRRGKPPRPITVQVTGKLSDEAELAQLVGGVGVDDAAAGVDHRARGVGERLCGDPDLLDVALGRGLVAGQVERLGARLVLDVGAREVLGHVHQDRARAAGRGDVEGRMDVFGDVAAGPWTMNECLTIGIVMPLTSASWKPSVPISSVRTWPVMNTVGTESMIASAIAVTRLVAPGPEVAIATPTRPEAFA